MKKLKKAISVIIAVIMAVSAFSALPLSASAAEIENTEYKDESPATWDESTSKFDYEVIYDGTARIIDYNGIEAVVEIPGEIDGYTVASIGEDAFDNCDFLKSIRIPDSVNYIPISAFSYCTNLQSFEVDADNWYYSSIDGVLFCDYGSILCIYPEAKSGAEYVVPSSVTDIHYSAFANCSNLQSIILPDGLKTIDSYAFSYCKNLTSITIPDSVTYIGRNLFAGCQSLVNVKLPEGISKLEGYMFESCSSLKSFEIPSSVNCISDGVFFECMNLENVIIPDSVVSIGNNAFYDTKWYNQQADGLVYAGKVAYSYKGIIPESITIKTGTKGIAECAFEYCSNLKSVTIPDSVISVGKNAFNETAWYDSQTDGLVYAGKVAYKYKGDTNNLDTIVLNSDTKGIAGEAFLKCTNLTKIIIPNGTEIIEKSAFYRCEKLTDVSIPDSIMLIFDEAFFGCNEMRSISFPKTIKNIGERAVGWEAHFENDNSWSYWKISGFTIGGYTDTAAEEYANDNGFEFIALSDRILGDVNGDGVLTVADATEIQKNIVSLVDFTSEQLVIADFNCDGKVNVNDVTEIQKTIVGIK